MPCQNKQAGSLGLSLKKAGCFSTSDILHLLSTASPCYHTPEPAGLYNLSVPCSFNPVSVQPFQTPFHNAYCQLNPFQRDFFLSIHSNPIRYFVPFIPFFQHPPVQTAPSNPLLPKNGRIHSKTVTTPPSQFSSC